VETVRVVIVDDQEPFRRAGAAVIEAMDDFVLVGVAETGEASLELARALTPDLVLMDVNLPGMNGLEAARLLRRIDPAPVVVLLSTYDQSDYGDETHDCGAAAYLSKSAFEPDLLRRVWLDVRG
jgi:DNA-binding NarL/FixJ family response regulator